MCVCTCMCAGDLDGKTPAGGVIPVARPSQRGHTGWRAERVREAAPGDQVAVGRRGTEPSDAFFSRVALWHK